MSKRARSFMFHPTFRNHGFWVPLLGLAFLLGSAGRALCDDSVSQDPSLVSKGKGVFENHTCNACHTIGKGIKTGPDLSGVLQRRSVPWLKKWIKNPDAVFASGDPIAAEFKKKIAKAEPGYSIQMPALSLTDDDVDAVIAYIKSQSK